MDVDNEGVVRGLLEAFNERRWNEFASGYAEGAVLVYPQSGERIVGREAIVGLVRAFPTAPFFTVKGSRAWDDSVLIEADVDYGQGPPWKGLFLYDLEDGSVVSETAYFAEPFPPAEWRAPFLES